MSNIQERDVMIEPWFSISINGKLVGEDLLKYVEEIQLEDEEDKLPLLRITIRDVDKKWLNDKGIAKGTAIKSSIGHRTSHSAKFDGKITHVEADFQLEGVPTLIIGAIDKGINLQKERKPRTWKKKKVSDIIKVMLKECGLKGEVEDTKAVLEYVRQEQESDLEFITRWRKRLNWRFYRLKNGHYYYGQKRKANKVKTLGYQTGGLEIIGFQPQFIEFETDDKSDIEDPDNDKGKKTKAKVPATKKSSSGKPVGKA